MTTQGGSFWTAPDKLVPPSKTVARYELNSCLTEHGGHIGYSVRPSERRKGYAKAMRRFASGNAESEV